MVRHHIIWIASLCQIIDRRQQVSLRLFTGGSGNNDDPRMNFFSSDQGSKTPCILSNDDEVFARRPRQDSMSPYHLDFAGEPHSARFQSVRGPSSAISTRLQITASSRAFLFHFSATAFQLQAFRERDGYLRKSARPRRLLSGFHHRNPQRDRQVCHRHQHGPSQSDM